MQRDTSVGPQRGRGGRRRGHFEAHEQSGSWTISSGRNTKTHHDGGHCPGATEAVWNTESITATNPLNPFNPFRRVLVPYQQQACQHRREASRTDSADSQDGVKHLLIAQKRPLQVQGACEKSWTQRRLSCKAALLGEQHVALDTEALHSIERARKT